MRIVYGPHAVRALFKAGREIAVLHLLRSMKRRAEMEAIAKDSGARLMLCDRDQLDSIAGSRHHQGVVAEVADRRDYNEDWLESRFAQPAPNSLVLALDSIEDPRNLGACVRTAAAAGVDALLVPKSRGARMTPVAEKAASGGAEILPIIRVSNLVRRLDWFKAKGVQVIGAHEDAPLAWDRADYDQPSLLVLGSEGKGLRRLTMDACDQLVSLPVAGGIQSLNASVATGVLLYEVLRQRRVAENP